ncbi:hypothetical protein SDJN02_27702, partial [Cucurbita argyrosperma subsp. argyrosperma]
MKLRNPTQHRSGLMHNHHLVGSGLPTVTLTSVIVKDSPKLLALGASVPRRSGCFASLSMMKPNWRKPFDNLTFSKGRQDMRASTHASIYRKNRGLQMMGFLFTREGSLLFQSGEVAVAVAVAVARINRRSSGHSVK